MMKSICTLTRRADYSRRQFQDYYETQHSQLAIQHFPFVGYVRNHLVADEEIGFDTISEFWAEDVDKLASLMTGPVGELLREDERRFMDQARIAPGYAEETVISAAPGPARRYALLLNWQGDFDPVAWAQSHRGELPALSVDKVAAWQQPAFPAQAVVWTPERAMADALPEQVSATVLEVERIETPPAQLLG